MQENVGQRRIVGGLRIGSDQLESPAEALLGLVERIDAEAVPAR